jgi:hypothetical protein
MFPATPLLVRQAPDNKTLRKTTILKIDDFPLSTPPIAQEYFEPGVNTKLNRRSKPKTNYTLPSDMPTLPTGFVPVNQTPGANGEEPPQIIVKETQPADLIEVFARIAAEEKALASMPKYGVDTGTMLMREYTTALKEARVEKKVESMLNEGFTPVEVESAMGAVRMEEAVKKAKEPPKAASVQTALAETFGVGVGTEPELEFKPPRNVTKPLGRPSLKDLSEKTGVSVEELREGAALEKRGKERLAFIQKTGELPPF